MVERPFLSLSVEPLRSLIAYFRGLDQKGEERCSTKRERRGCPRQGEVTNARLRGEGSTNGPPSKDVQTSAGGGEPVELSTRGRGS